MKCFKDILNNILKEIDNEEDKELCKEYTMVCKYCGHTISRTDDIYIDKIEAEIYCNKSCYINNISKGYFDNK